MKLTLHVWRQKSPSHAGRMVQYEHTKVSPHMSFLEMLDVLNEQLIAKGEEPVAFDHDCREGICGQCGFMINGVAHGRQRTRRKCHSRAEKKCGACHGRGCMHRVWRLCGGLPECRRRSV